MIYNNNGLLRMGVIVNELYLCVLHPNLIEYTADTKSQNANTKCVYYMYAAVIL